jgi:exonuclease III
LIWNCQGLNSKLKDNDFLKLISSYDLCLFSETWLSKTNCKSINVDGYKFIHCQGHKFNKRAKRHDGGVSIMYKTQLEHGIKSEKIRDQGIIWIKLDKTVFNLDKDVFICLCYIPPDKSVFYHHSNNFDFFTEIESDILHYGEIGTVYICGDLNARTATIDDFVNNIHLDKYLDSFPDDLFKAAPQRRTSRDQTINSFGHKLLQLCINTNVNIVNGRHGNDAKEGNFTYMSANGRSVVDYVLTNTDNFELIKEFEVKGITEFSDHCPIRLCLFADCNINTEHSTVTNNRIMWQEEMIDACKEALLIEKPVFDNISQGLINGDINIDTAVNEFTDTLYKVAFTNCGIKGKVHTRNATNSKAPWFNNECNASKNLFMKVKKKNRIHKSNESFNRVLQAKIAYNNYKCKARLDFENREQKQLENLAKSNPKLFWKKIKKYRKNKSQAENIPIEELTKHFEKISNCKDDTSDWPKDFPAVNIDELDKPIDESEVTEAIKNLNRNKSPGLDGLPSEIFIDCSEILVPYITNMFNYIFDNECYPEAWTKGIIIPIPKKGDLKDANNYRGVTLINTFSKIFSTIIRNRLEKYAEQTELLCNCQFGFRKKRRTSDCVFILSSIINSQLSQKRKLYTAFVDFQKAFDSINRDALWSKLLSMGMSSKIVKILQVIYTDVKSCVRQFNTVSEFFNVSLGVKQGEPLSPLLFLMFINDMENILQSNDLENYVRIDTVTILMLLFADDAVLMSKTAEGLQKLIDQLYVYCQKWKLTVNTLKTKICVFEKRKSKKLRFMFNNNVLEQVDSFTYLGITMNYNGSFKYAAKNIADQGRKAILSILLLFEKINFNISSKLSLFHKLITPILLYGAELWGLDNKFTAEIDKVLIKFCKSILGVQKSTPNAAVLGELGQLPLSTMCKVRAIKYWLHIVSNKTTLLYKTYSIERQQVNTNNLMNCWSYKIKDLLDNLGYSNIWLSENSEGIPFMTLKQRITDQYMQSWSDSIKNMNRLEFYAAIKEEFKFEKYLDEIMNVKQRKALTKLRCSAHNLQIEIGRHQKTPRNERHCKICKSKSIENEYHFVLICPILRELRLRYLPKNTTSFPTKNKLINLFQNSSNQTISNLSKFISVAMVKRNEINND